MALHPYQELRPEYEGYVRAVRPLQSKVALIDQVARRLTRPDALRRFDAIAEKTSIPQVVQATICEREDGCDFTKNPGQGDPLSRPSTHVPRGRPPLGAPPNDRFPVTWEYAALDAFTVCDRLNVNSAPWSLAYACWKWEGYNGFGYRSHGRRSPYVVGGTNLQQPGKFTSDGRFNPDVVDVQLGCLPVAIRMIELVPALAFGAAVERAAEAIMPPVLPVPAAVGGGLTGAKWVQAMLNLIVNPSPPLKVDGSYGRLTRDAVRKAQEVFGLPVNGLVDRDLCAAIDARLAEMRPSVR